MMKNWLCVCVAVLLTSSLLRADIAPGPRPRPAPPVADKSVPFTIEAVDGNGPTRLIVPRKFAAGARAALDIQNDAVAEAPSKTPTVLAGFFLTLSMVCGGLWVVRSRNVLGTHTVVGILVGVAFLAIGSAVLFANAAPFQPVAPVRAVNDRIIIEVVENGDAVKMIVPKARLARVMGNVGGVGGGTVPNPGGVNPVRPIGRPEVRPLPAPVPGGIGIPAPAPVPLPNPLPKPLEEK